MYQKFGKRILDIIGSISGLLFLSPVFILVSGIVRIGIGRPIIFCQERPGKGNKIFKLYKFRTMKNLYDSRGKLLPDEKRLGKLGKVLRASSLDELPELWNILKGDMSIVGPRPLLTEYLNYYTEEQKHRHDVRPGLTGLAQVNGRNSISWDERFEFDLEYVKHITFLNDVKIMIKTLKKVLFREGIHSETAVTMEKFTSQIKNKKGYQ